MPLMIRLNRVIDVSDGEIERYRQGGYVPYEPIVNPDRYSYQPPESDYNDLDEEQLIAVALERGIIAEGKTRRQIINLLKRDSGS